MPTPIAPQLAQLWRDINPYYWLGVTSVVLFGISTDMCVSTTARMAANLGYRTIVVGDACQCFDLPDGNGGVYASHAEAALLHHCFNRHPVRKIQ